MTFTLSIEGVNHWHQILSSLCRYIGMLRFYGTNLPEWIYDELRSLHDFAYKYRDESSPEDLVEGKKTYAFWLCQILKLAGPTCTSDLNFLSTLPFRHYRGNGPLPESSS